MHSSTIDVKNYQIISPNVIRTEWCHSKETIPDSKTSNIFIATFTTCWARLRLYKVLEMLGERVLYYDTDSVIYVKHPNTPNPPTGELKSELRPSEHIMEFLSAGPKNYAYVTNKGIEKCKVKGFTLNFANAQNINFQTMKEILLSSDPLEQSIITTNPCKITRNKNQNLLYNRKTRKRYRIVYTKRCVNWSTYETYPYGY